MLRDSQAFTSFSIDDVAHAKQFYGEILGLTITEGDGMLRLKTTGGGEVMLYPKRDHRAASFTVLNFPVPELERTVAALKERGVRFEHYDRPGLKTDPDGICRSGDMKIAWFTDPAGNILSVLQR